jgi:ketosteroid isomerase-like protein
MTEHPNVARIKDGYTALANGDFAALNKLLAEDVVWHFGGRNQLSGDYLPRPRRCLRLPRQAHGADRRHCAVTGSVRPSARANLSSDQVLGHMP